VSGQTVCTGHFTAREKAGWVLELVWMFWRKDSSFASAEIRTADLPAYIQVIVLNILPHAGLKKMHKSVLIN
jgi:hypothetical protein